MKRIEKMTSEELKEEQLINDVKEQRIRKRKRKIRAIFACIELGLLIIITITMLKFCGT